MDSTNNIGPPTSVTCSLSSRNSRFAALDKPLGSEVVNKMGTDSTENLEAGKGNSSFCTSVDDYGIKNAAKVEKNNVFKQQVICFNPALYSYYYGTPHGHSTGNPPVSNILFPPGLPQLPSAPGFLTAANYQLGHTSSPALRLSASPLLLPGHAGTPLHFAAIIGDKQKLSDNLQDYTNLEARDRWGRVALVYTVLGNHQECTEMLLRAGAKPDAVDCHGRTALHYAAYKGHLGCIKAILHAVESQGLYQIGSSVGVWLAQDRRGVTPLHHAAVHENHKCLQAILKYTAPGTLDTEDHKKRTPLHWAAAYGSEENVRLLIKHDANNLMPDQEGKTPLHWASMSKAEGAKNCVRTLIGAAPLSVNWQDFDGITALHLAVEEARKDTVDVILSVPKCNVDLTDNQFRTALHWACNRGITAIVGRLVERGSHLGAVDVYGATPLHYAAKFNHTDTVELLMRLPCVRDNPTKAGHTALLWAAACGADTALAALVCHGASLSSTDPRGCTALHIAAGAGHVEAVLVLLKLRAPPDTCGHDGRTPLLHAAQAGHTQIVKILAKAGASLDHRDNEGQCALHHAVLGGHLFLAQILIRAGTSVNIQDYYGRTPLHMAAFRGLTDIMFLLLENRGDVNARDNQGQSPLHWAAQQGHLGAVNILLDFHAYPNYTQSTSDRYTALDCAYVSEHLEVAEVLMEAGGLSVTTIMEMAATKIQALARGYITRKSNKLNKLGKKEEDTPLTVEITKENISVDNETMKEPLLQQLPEGNALVDSQLNVSCLSSESVFISSDSLNQKKVSPGNEEQQNLHPVPQKRAVFSDSSPYNSVSGQRRSNLLASSLRRGARKKTVRNLNLPEPGELGLTLPVSAESAGTGTDGLLETCSQKTSLRVAQVLQHSGNIATAVASIGEEKHHQNGRQILEDKTTELHRIAEKVNVNQSKYEGRPVVSAEARQRAQERWNSKLATLTLQTMQRPASAAAGTTFSYNLISSSTVPHSTPPTRKHKLNSKQ